ncbi:M15 family metallopeptidase [bacterium]|nr:M15 family metallopeptidase [bacterium]
MNVSMVSRGKYYARLLLLMCLISDGLAWAQAKRTPEQAISFLKAYPDILVEYVPGQFDESVGSFLLASGKRIAAAGMLRTVRQDYFAIDKDSMIPDYHNPGILRDHQFFMAMYGHNYDEVEEKITEIDWFGLEIKVTTANAIDQRLMKIRDELLAMDNYNAFKDYLTPIGGTFHWRKIAGTNQRSMHSYGAAIDLNSQGGKGCYYKWHYPRGASPDRGRCHLGYPKEIIDTFEKYCFIWGGRWQRHDTMHFEYRPEFFTSRDACIVDLDQHELELRRQEFARENPAIQPLPSTLIRPEVKSLHSH